MDANSDTAEHLKSARAAEEAESFRERSRVKLRELEDIRLNKLKSLEFRKKLAVPIGFVLTPILGFIDYWLILWQSGSDDTAAGVSIAGLAGLWGWVSQPKRQYARAYKKEILPEVANLIGDLEYKVDGKIPMEDMKPSKIIPGHTSYGTEDLFFGQHNGANIQFSEINLRKKSGKSTVTVFKGLCILLSYESEKFAGHTILTKDKGAIGGWFQNTFGSLEHADLVDPEFEDLFDVFTNDQVEARYLIDPVIIERLKALYEEYDGSKLMAAFYQNRFLILIASNTNHFEPADIRTSALNEDGIVSMKQEVREILSIVDQLALYDRHSR